MRTGRPLVIYLDDDLSSWLQRMHDDEGYPKAVLVRLALREYRARHENRIEG
jgi:hypothetical protein